MNRGLVPLVSVWLALAAVFVQSVAVPQAVLACSCISPLPTLQEVVASDPEVSVIVGTVGPAQAEVTPVAVEAWFHGARPADFIWLSGGTQMMTSCDVMMKAGERRLFVLYGSHPGPYSNNMCSPGGALDTAEGAAALADAEALFGAAQPPASPEATDQPAVPLEPSASEGLGWAWLAGGVAAALLVLLVIGLLAARRRSLS